MAVILYFLIEINLYVLTVAGKVVACQIDQHDVFGIFLRIFQQGICPFAVDFHITAAESCPGNGVDAGMAVGNLAVRFRRRTLSYQ